MKHFSRVLADLMKERDLTQRGLGALACLDHVKISRLLNGNTRADRDDIESLNLAFTDRQQQLRLWLAHIRDELPEDSFAALEINLRSGISMLADSAGSVLDQLPPRVALAIIGLMPEVQTNPALGEVFVDLAKALCAPDWSDYPLPKPLETSQPSAATKKQRKPRNLSRFEEVDSPTKYPPAAE